MKKYLYILILIFIVISINLTGCDNSNKTDNTKVLNIEGEVNFKIMTTNKLLYYMVKDIVQDRHYVNYMFKDEAEQWSFVFSDDSLENVSNQELFFYIGADFEPWIQSFIDGLNKDSVGVINASKGSKLISYNTEVTYNNVVLKNNPYYWMDLDNYRIMMLNIKNVIEEKDPQNRSYYEDNFSKAKKQADDFDKQLKALSDKMEDCVFLVQGDKLNYFLKYNNMKYLNLDDYYKLPPENKADREDFEKKLGSAKKLVFLCEADSDTMVNKELITKYKIKTAKVMAYKDGFSFQQIFKNDIDNLNDVLSK